MKHRFEIEKNPSGYDIQTWVIEAAALTEAVLAELAEYLIAHVELIYTANKTVTKDTLWPIKLDINGQLDITEEVFWGMVCETLPHSQDLVLQYLATLCQLAKQTKRGYLLFSDEAHFTGSFALKPFLNRVLAPEENRYCDDMPVYDGFIEFIRCCDLQFETFQDAYIERVLAQLCLLNDNKLIELLCLRLNNGLLTDKNFRFLHFYLGYSVRYPARLKSVIDYVIDSGSDDISESYRESEASYLTLCAAIYGDNLKETAEVMDYVKEKLGSHLQAVQPSQMANIQRIRSECEAYRAFQPLADDFLDSSFHLYDLNSKKWLPLTQKVSEAT